MVTLIRATCTTCGSIAVPSTEVTVTQPPNRIGWYFLRCPICHDPIRREAPPEVVALLATGGVHPHLTEDDVMDLTVWLEEHDPMEEMSA